MKKLALIAMPLGLTVAGSVMALATPAQAVPAPAAESHPAGSVFVHGTRGMAHFWARSDCAAHASWEVAQVKKSRSAALLPELNVESKNGGDLRFTCYPVQGAQWSYLVGYTSTTGAPIATSDRFVETTHRASYGPAKNPVDADNIWYYNHHVDTRGPSATLRNCTGWLQWFGNLVETNPHTHLISADNACFVAPGRAGYDVSYLATTKTAGLRGDTPTQVNSAPMLDTLGYDYGQVVSGD
ncbi:hypothetical protein V3G39_13595 [Dermatophilaceae bacterium Sec6.4]